MHNVYKPAEKYSLDPSSVYDMRKQIVEITEMVILKKGN